MDCISHFASFWSFVLVFLHGLLAQHVSGSLLDIFLGAECLPLHRGTVSFSFNYLISHLFPSELWDTLSISSTSVMCPLTLTGAEPEAEELRVFTESSQMFLWVVLVLNLLLLHLASYTSTTKFCPLSIQHFGPEEDILTTTGQIIVYVCVDIQL